MALRILIAPSGFKESLGVDEVVDGIAQGVRRVFPGAEILRLPFVDGGEGFTKTLVSATAGELMPALITGPVGRPVAASIGFLGGAGERTAVLEIAAAAGLRLVPTHQRDPSRTTSRGVGELIKAALDAGAKRILVGCGNSGVNDGGAGMAQALGAGLLDAAGAQIGLGGGELARLASIDLSSLDPRLREVTIEVAVNWQNLLIGPNGVSRVFGPQKGATPEMIEQLEAALCNYADVIRRHLLLQVGDLPGGGASGGLGTGLFALLGAHLRPRFEVILRYLDLEGLLERADLVMTAEGTLDDQTLRSKVPAEVARWAKQRALPVIALAGRLGDGAEQVLAHGVDAYFSIAKGPTSLAQSMAAAGPWLSDAAEQAMRAVRVGCVIAARCGERIAAEPLEAPALAVVSSAAKSA